MAASPGGSPSYKTLVSEKWIEFDKFKEDTINDIMKINETLFTPHVDAGSSEQSGTVADRFFQMAVQTNKQVAALELKVKENEEIINKLIHDNHIKVMGDIDRLYTSYSTINYVTKSNHDESIRNTQSRQWRIARMDLRRSWR